MIKYLFFIFLNFLFISGKCQTHSLIGYWHNWNDASAPYIQLDQVDNRYNILEVSFAETTSPSDMTMVFVPDGITQSDFITKVQAVQSQGKKVLISIGGANASVDLTTTANKNAFISSIGNIISTYGFDGIDIDIEHGNSILILAGGTISAPADPAIINLIDAVKQIMANYRITHPNKKLMLTMAPETAYVQGGQSAYGGIWGGYLPIINALRDSLDILQVQLYNSGSIFGLDGTTYTDGTVDFIVAMTEAVIRGFNTPGGFFTGIPANKVAVGLPACVSAAGSGYVSPQNVAAAINYLRGIGPRPGSYILQQPGGYLDLRGMMTWSVNWDKVNTCNPAAYQYAQNYEQIFSTVLAFSVVDFRAGNNNGFAKLTWDVNDDGNIRHYNIQRSVDGISFNDIGRIYTLNNGLQSHSYQFLDSMPNPGNNYYRLQIVNPDMTYSASKVINVKFRSNEWVISPNPVGSVLYIKTQTVQSGEYRITNILGQIVIEGKIYNNNSIPVCRLREGVYYLILNNKIAKFIKM